MINFDSNHSYVEGNLNEKKGKIVLQKIIASGLIITNLLSFSGCSKTIPCDLQGEHAHYYISDENFGRYIVSEKSSTSGLNRTENYTFIDSEEEKLLNFINKNDLFEINANKDTITNITSTQSDHKEYRYKFVYSTLVPVLHFNGKNTYYTYISTPTTGYSWTSDPNHSNLTGEERVCHYLYYGYKIIKNEQGEYDLIKSNPVDNINDLPENYKYIQKTFYKVVNLYNKEEVLNYEDGQIEEKELYNEEEYNHSITRQ